jgi:endo-1,4-beta-xylanase
LWGIDDSNTWLNDFPIPGRTNYPLLFARGYKPKPVIKKIIDLFK